jgi:hypothetical protein
VPQALLTARARVLGPAAAGTRELLPAWRRYQGGFYRSARPALTEAAQSGNMVIISGGYGVAAAGELIAWYDRPLRLADWPAGLLESALISHARQSGAQTVMAFAARTSAYARLVRRTPWGDAGLAAVLVTITGSQGALSGRSRGGLAWRSLNSGAGSTARTRQAPVASSCHDRLSGRALPRPAQADGPLHPAR